MGGGSGMGEDMAAPPMQGVPDAALRSKPAGCRGCPGVPGDR